METLNKNQKVVLCLYIIAVLVVIFLHNPTQGYWSISTKEKAWDEQSQGTNCREDYGSLYKKTVCDYELPFYKSYSIAALTDWFSLVSNILWLLFIMSCVAAISLYTLSDKNQK